MSRRDLTLWLAGGLAAVLLGVGATAQVPYVSLSPGPAIDTLGVSGSKPILDIKGARTYPTDGKLDLTTVNVRDHITLLSALRGWLSSSQAVIPREFIYPENQSAQQNEAQNQQEMVGSKDSATEAALTELGLATLAVATISKGSPATGKLQPGDVLVSVDGHKVAGPSELRGFIRKHSIGDEVVLGVVRAGESRSVTITTIASTEDKTKAAVGIITKISSQVKVDITLSDVGGPSAGLMFALGIIDKLGAQSLTGGKHVAGTGTIASDGTVGPIGGIAEKLLGARAAGAVLFLVPTANCADAAKHRPDGLQLAKVANLKDALTALSVVRRGGRPVTC